MASGELSTVVLQLQPHWPRPARGSLHAGSRAWQVGPLEKGSGCTPVTSGLVLCDGCSPQSPNTVYVQPSRVNMHALGSAFCHACQAATDVALHTMPACALQNNSLSNVGDNSDILHRFQARSSLCCGERKAAQSAAHSTHSPQHGCRSRS